MKKAPEAFRTISEVAELLETPAHVLRFWESKFYQIRPVKRAGGRRYYRPDDVALINGIRQLLQVQGLTIRGAQRVLQEKGVRHVIGLGETLPELAAEVGAPEAGTVEPPPAPDPAPARAAAPEPAPVAQVPPRPVAPPAPVAAASVRPPADVAPDTRPEDDGLDGPRLPALLRAMPRAALVAQHDRAAALARRIDLLLDRMSEASGAGRW